jgi:hypothetical protein
MIQVKNAMLPSTLDAKIYKAIELSGQKIHLINEQWTSLDSAPVFTVKGIYSARGWTEWTQGFQFGSEILQFDASNDPEFLVMGREHTREVMAPHISHIGVHDHGFNNVSTYGNLLRLIKEGVIPEDKWEIDFYRLALRLSGAIQASRWTSLPDNLGYVYSFNGPHSLFADTIRSMRVLAVSHLLGHHLMVEQDRKINLLERLLQHLESTARYTVYHGEGRDHYDVPGRVAHESIFNVTNGSYRCPNSQQGYSPFTTWIRGLAWVILGCAEEIEFLQSLPETEFDGIKIDQLSGKQNFLDRIMSVAKETAEFYIQNTPIDGIPYWDTGAPGLSQMGDYLNRPADPYNQYEPVDSSAAAITAQGLLRLGHFLSENGEKSLGDRFFQAGLVTADSLLNEPYISEDADHQGLLLHSVYHRPNDWDYVPEGKNIPCGESCMWGDYHLRELIVYLQRLISKESIYLTFFNI